jgi:hypothetical protein
MHQQDDDDDYDDDVTSVTNMDVKFRNIQKQNTPSTSHYKTMLEHGST